MTHTPDSPIRAAVQTQPLPSYTPAKSGPSWIMIALMVVFGGPILLVGGLVFCLVLVGMLGASSERFDEVSAELNQTSFDEMGTEQSVPTPTLNAPASSSQADEDYDPFDV